MKPAFDTEVVWLSKDNLNLNDERKNLHKIFSDTLTNKQTDL